MMLLSSSVSAPSSVRSTFLFDGLGGIAHRAREARIKIADRHHARLRDFILQTVRKLGELVDVAIHTTNKAIELREHFGDVGGNFGQRAREDVEIVIAIHLQFAELSERMDQTSV